MKLTGFVQCAKDNKVNNSNSKAYFGPLGMGGLDNISDTATLHSQSIEVSEKFWGANQWIIESPGEDNPTFTVPLNKIKNGHPAVRVDPLEELEKARQAFNGSDLDFYKQDREIVIQRPVSLAGWCAKDGLEKAGFETKDFTIQIKYKGDPELTKTPVLNAQLGNNNPNQIQVGDQPLKITEMTFQPNMPHHVGACPATTKIRVNYKGQGEGEIKIRVNDGGNTIYQSNKIAFDAKNGAKFYDFEIDTPAVSKFDLNKTFTRDLKVYVLGKDDEAPVWSGNYQVKDQADWKYRCTPQLNPGLGGQGHIGGYDNGGNEALGKGTIQAKPQRGSLGKAAPSEPAPKPKRAPLN